MVVKIKRDNGLKALGFVEPETTQQDSEQKLVSLLPRQVNLYLTQNE
jgi:hypothetical protein